MFLIKELEDHRLEDFFSYLSVHISENGHHNDLLYFPLSKEQSFLSNELKTKFKDGMNKATGEIGWRKIWVALNEKGEIIGHIDLRSANQLNAEHRVVLGMGVDTQWRGIKIGQSLLEFVIVYCKKSSNISWIDLEVMTNNTPAKNLYEKLGFKQLSQTEDMFRINNKSYSSTLMTMKVEN